MNRDSNKGFTLIEVLITISLIGILAVFTTPLWGSYFRNRQLEQAAWQMAADIRLAQAEAIAHNQPSYVFFYRYGESYKCELPEGESKYIELPEGVDLLSTNFADDKITFSALGAPNGGRVHLDFKESPTGGLYVIVAPATGRVRVSETPPD